MAINVGYEPVGAIGWAATRIGQGQAQQRQLENQMRLSQLAMQQRAQEQQAYENERNRQFEEQRAVWANNQNALRMQDQHQNQLDLMEQADIYRGMGREQDFDLGTAQYEHNRDYDEQIRDRRLQARIAAIDDPNNGMTPDEREYLRSQVMTEGHGLMRPKPKAPSPQEVVNSQIVKAPDGGLAVVDPVTGEVKPWERKQQKDPAAEAAEKQEIARQAHQYKMEQERYKAREKMRLDLMKQTKMVSGGAKDNPTTSEEPVYTTQEIEDRINKAYPEAPPQSTQSSQSTQQPGINPAQDYGGAIGDAQPRSAQNEVAAVMASPTTPMPVKRAVAAITAHRMDGGSLDDPEIKDEVAEVNHFIKSGAANGPLPQPKEGEKPRDGYVYIITPKFAQGQKPQSFVAVWDANAKRRVGKGRGAYVRLEGSGPESTEKVLMQQQAAPQAPQPAPQQPMIEVSATQSPFR